VTVNRGRGAHRIAISHLVATSLNDPDEVAPASTPAASGSRLSGTNHMGDRGSGSHAGRCDERDVPGGIAGWGLWCDPGQHRLSSLRTRRHLLVEEGTTARTLVLKWAHPGRAGATPERPTGSLEGRAASGREVSDSHGAHRLRVVGSGPLARPWGFAPSHPPRPRAV
jgi:hypothetical protein